MKLAINVVLGIVIAALGYFCYDSILSPIRFQEEKEIREAAVKKRLIEIRSAEEQYRLQHEGTFCDTLENLVDFVKNGKIASIIKVGDLTDDQIYKMELTEQKAMAIIRKGDMKEIKEKGLENFRRDTVWVNLIDSLYDEGFEPDSLPFIPYSGGEKFDIMATIIINKSGTVQNVMQCAAGFEKYLKGLNEREVYNLIDFADKSGRYPGLKIGDLYTANNNAGNWE